MQAERKVAEEIRYIRQAGGIKVASVGTTARLLEKFLVLPRRTYMEFCCINFLVSNPEDAAYCMAQVDGAVDYVLIDVESKQEVDLMLAARKHVRQSTIIAYKPNDASLEAADLLLRHHFEDDLSGRRLLVLGAGNIASKLALRLCERNASIQLHSRNFGKVKRIADGLNEILPRYTSSRIEAVERLPDVHDYYDAMVSFVAADRIADERMAILTKSGGIAVDGGINNFSPGFLQQSRRRGVACTRLDVRLGFAYVLLSIGHDAATFYNEVKGERMVDGVRLLAGGVIGSRGDVIVDRVVNPTQIIGLANGVGGIMNEADYAVEDRLALEKARTFIARKGL